MKAKEVMVVKCGGSIINKLTPNFFKSLQELKNNGYDVVLVHGGGPDIQHVLTALNIQSEFVNGMRKTSKEVLQVVQMVLSGKVNKNLVMMLQKERIPSVGLSGCDGNLLEAKAIDVTSFGYVGEVTKVNQSLLKSLLDGGYMPVISSLGIDPNGDCLNINADLAAGAVAQALHAKQLLFVTDVPGILNNDTLIQNTTPDEINDLIDEGIISGGMIPKVKAALSALSETLHQVHIISGTESFVTDDGDVKGTSITNNQMNGVMNL
ncbi:acetylglutamate kinase [Priestia koreensis]